MQNLNILITRPAQSAQPLCEKIKALGATPILFPTLEILKTPKQTSLQAAIKTLEKIDLAIFMSPVAATYGMQAITEQWPVLPSLQWVAIGPGTAKALQAFGIKQVLLPRHLPYESETLLILDALQEHTLQGKSVLIFQGRGGRTLLYKTLKQRGAHVKKIETYLRSLPLFPTPLELPAKTWDVVICTSAESLKNLMVLVGSKNTAKVITVPIVIVGRRMVKLASTLGFRKIILAEGADDGSILTALTEGKD